MIPSDTAFNTAIFNALCSCLEVSPATSIVATPHSGDRSFRLNSESTKYPPLAVVDSSSVIADASALIRRAYQEPESVPKPGRNQNVIYYDIAEDDSPDAGYQTFAGESPTSAGAFAAVSSFLPYRLIVVCYGPACVRNANRIRDFIFLDGAGYPRSILRKAGIWPVPRPPVPVLLHEEDGTLWRRRADLVIQLRVTDTCTRENRRPGISEPPAVILK